MSTLLAVTACSPASVLDRSSPQSDPETTLKCGPQTHRSTGDQGGSDWQQLVFECLGGGHFAPSQVQTPTIVNVWAPWCPPCRDEYPLLADVSEITGPDVDVMSIASFDSPSSVSAFVAAVGVNLPVALDSAGQVAKQFGIVGLPFTLFINPQGEVIDIKAGPFASAAEWVAYSQVAFGS